MERIHRAFPSDEFRERAHATNLIKHECKFDLVALFYTLSFGFAAGSDRSLQALLERCVEMADCDELPCAAFHEWLGPSLVAPLREILDDRGVVINCRLLFRSYRGSERGSDWILTVVGSHRGCRRLTPV